MHKIHDIFIPVRFARIVSTRNESIDELDAGRLNSYVPIGCALLYEIITEY